jgi:hypothetical protein
MTATIAASTAILKSLYPKGELPNANFKQNVAHANMSKLTDFVGEDRKVALQTEWAQGLGADFTYALGSLKQGTYYRFNVTRVEYFGIARIKGQALKAAVKDEGALTDLWKNEMDGISQGVTRMLGIFAYRSGTGSIGQISSGSNVGTATITLASISDAANFCVGMRVYGSATDGATLRSGGATATLTAIDRDAGTLTISGNWNASIAAIAASDFLYRAGDMNLAPTGFGGWIVGGSAPGTLFGLSRNPDPVRLSGQAYDAVNVPMYDAVVEAAARVGAQGGITGETLYAHPRDVANFKKQLEGKVQYERTTVQSKVAGVSFKAIEVEGDNGTIKILSDVNCPRNTAWLINESRWKLHSLGPAPHILDYDDNTFLRVATDDAYEVRVGMYGNQWCNGLVDQIKLTNFGV